MKKLILLIGLMLPFQSHAGWTDSFWFEPGLLCVVGGAAGYTGGSSGNEAQTAALGCLVGFGIGYLINDHYDNKFGSQYQKDIADLNRTIQEFQAQQAQSSLRGDDEQIGLRTRHIVPAKKLPDGSVQPAYYRETLTLPGANSRVGE